MKVGPYRTAPEHVHDWRWTLDGPHNAGDHYWYCCNCGKIAGFWMYHYLNLKHGV